MTVQILSAIEQLAIKLFIHYYLKYDYNACTSFYCKPNFETEYIEDSDVFAENETIDAKNRGIYCVLCQGDNAYPEGRHLSIDHIWDEHKEEHQEIISSLKELPYLRLQDLPEETIQELLTFVNTSFDSTSTNIQIINPVQDYHTIQFFDRKSNSLIPGDVVESISDATRDTYYRCAPHEEIFKFQFLIELHLLKHHISL